MTTRSIWGLALALAAVSAAPVAAQPAPRPTSIAGARVARHLDRIRHDPPALRAFLRALPKGADLHTHLGGAVYAETMIRWAGELNQCVDVPTLRLTTCSGATTERPATAALADPLLYRQLVDAFSMRNWNPARGPGHDQFFDTFGRFRAAFREGPSGLPAITGQAVAEAVHRAALQHVLHVEFMITPGSGADAPAGGLAADADTLRAAHERLLAGGLRDRVTERRRWLDAVEAEARKALGCGTPAARPGCDVSVRFIASALRGVAPAQVFAHAVFSFEMAAVDPRVVGVNMLMPEDYYIPMRDHALQMRMVQFLGQAYPSVPISLHAGELAFGLVPPEQLGVHVREAVEIAGARRIGHGTDIMYDADPAALLRTMARRRIAVEISLSSSDLILGVRGARHPLRQYLRAGVPVVLATDDEGVARSDLTNEYQRAVEEHGVTYRELKQMSRDSIALSFLPAAEKTRLLARLDAAFAAFEATR
jgi:adenosine deaminase